ncbi:1603_t:CDS:2, partial [Scutellospora calospora]
FIQAIGFASSYRSPPTHSTVVYYWMVIVVTVVFLGHLLIRFQPRWRYGPYKDEILLDGQPSSSIQMSSISQQQQVSQPQRSPSYKMQKGVLKDGQPVLLFHSNGDKRNSKRLSLYNHKRSSSVPNLLKDSESAKSAKSIESYLSHELV